MNRADRRKMASTQPKEEGTAFSFDRETLEAIDDIDDGIVHIGKVDENGRPLPMTKEEAFANRSDNRIENLREATFPELVAKLVRKMGNDNRRYFKDEGVTITVSDRSQTGTVKGHVWRGKYEPWRL